MIVGITIGTMIICMIIIDCSREHIDLFDKNKVNEELNPTLDKFELVSLIIM